MNPDAASLDNLKDIYVPPPVPWWPPAAGWWLVIAALAILLAVMVVWAWRKWHRDAYRRAALHELRGATSGAEVAEILKRTALCAYPRQQVASLTGPAWCQWLSETGGQEVTESIGRWLSGDVYRGENSQNLPEKTEFAAEWVRHHEPLES